MRREQFERMRHAAANLLALARKGEDVDRLSVEWAKQIVAAKRRPADGPVAHQQLKILAVMHDHPVEGYTGEQIRLLTGMEKRHCVVALCYMAKHGQLAMLKIPGRSHYFADDVALAQGRPLVVAAEERRCAREVKAKRIRPPKAPVPDKPVPRARATKPSTYSRARARKLPAPADRPMHEQGVYLQSMLPANVHIQTLPSGRDMRLVPTPPIHGIGAVDAWLRLTAPLRRRRKVKP